MENVTCLESLGEITSSKSDTFLAILMCYKGRLGVVPHLSLQAKNSDMTVLRVPDNTFNCNSGGESARMSVGVLDFSKVIYHCTGWNHLKVRGTGSNKALMLEDFEYPSPNLPFRDTIGQGNTKLNVTEQMINYNQIDLNSILAFKVLEQHILIVTERQDLSEADMYFVDYPVHTIQLVYKYKRVVDHHPVDVAMQKGPVFYLLTTQSIIRVPLGGSSTVITQDINSGRHMIALSRADLFVTQRFNQEGASSGKLLHIDSNSGNSRPVCHSRSHEGGAAGQCGITSPTLLSIISQSRALVLDESARFILINYQGMDAQINTNAHSYVTKVPACPRPVVLDMSDTLPVCLSIAILLRSFVVNRCCLPFVYVETIFNLAVQNISAYTILYLENFTS